ncbi:MAG: rubredoxin-like domain-containing protein [Candidatus Deferrimicrobiaceae bacterium]
MRASSCRMWRGTPCPSPRATSRGPPDRPRKPPGNILPPRRFPSGKIFTGMNRWECVICGYIHEGKEPPDICPVCDAPKEFFRLLGN